jgi:hypothetical protein
MKKTPKYVRQIEVGALSIKSIKASEKDGGATLSFNEVKETKKVSKEWVEKNNPQVDGYLVIYEEGDDSFSSKESFEGRYKKDEGIVTAKNSIIKDLESIPMEEREAYLNELIQNGFFPTKVGNFDTHGDAGKSEVEVSVRNLDSLNRPIYNLVEGHAAVKIKAIEENADGTADITPEEAGVDIFTVNQAFMHNQQPKVGGYFVITQANMQMYISEETFKERYK